MPTNMALTVTSTSPVPQIDDAWSGSAIGRFIARRLGVWQRLGPFFIQLFDRHPEACSHPLIKTHRCLCAPACVNTLTVNSGKGPALVAVASCACRTRAPPAELDILEILLTQGTLEWAKSVMKFDFDTVIPSHTAAPVRGGKAAFAACFPQLAAEQPDAVVDAG